MLNPNRPVLAISDLQIPFENEKALKFCAHIKKHFKVPDENVLSVGDECDIYFGGQWPKNPDGDYSAVNEIKVAREKLKEWGAIFPFMKLAVSNHGMRWVRKAIAAEIPSQILRAYEDIFDMPPGWKWQDEWRFNNLKYPFRMVHGTGYSGMNGHRNAAMDSKCSTLIGHLHSHAGIAHIHCKGMEQRIWGFNCGSLIDKQAYAFEYDKQNRVEPILGAGVIIDSGKTPIFIPLE